MVDGIRTLFTSEAKELVGKHVHLTIVEGGLQQEFDAHVDHVAQVAKEGTCLLTDHGDIRIDHVIEARAA
jgi:hypothetical protein